MALFNCFKKGFNCIADMKTLILVSKKNNLKATETVKYFSCTFYHEPKFTSHQFDAATLLKINIWRSFRWQFRAIWKGQIYKFCPLGANHGSASWVTELMESMNKWPATLSKLISITGLHFTPCHNINNE